jgi:cyclase
MPPLRIIARLDVKPPYVVKPIRFEGNRQIGNPRDLARKYYNQGADEIFYLDIVASLYQRNILLDWITFTSEDLFIPFAAGGGVKSIQDFKLLLHNGVDKVVINTFALHHDPNIIERAAMIFGSQSVVVHIEAKKWNDRWECYSDCGRIRSGKGVLDWVKKVEDLGAGEIFISSVDADGLQQGFDIELIKEVVSSVKIPVVAGSGAGSLDDILQLVYQAKPDAIAIASMLHYGTSTISEIKQFLYDHGVEVTL